MQSFQHQPKSKDGGLLDLFALTDWWLDTFNESERERIKKVCDPGGDMMLASGHVWESTGNAIKLLNGLFLCLDDPDDRDVGLRILHKSFALARANADVLDLHHTCDHVITAYESASPADRVEYARLVDACTAQIAIRYEVAELFREEGRRSLPEHKALSMLATLREMEGNYEEALELATGAKKQSWKGEWNEIIHRSRKALRGSKGGSFFSHWPLSRQRTDTEKSLSKQPAPLVSPHVEAESSDASDDVTVPEPPAVEQQDVDSTPDKQDESFQDSMKEHEGLQEEFEEQANVLRDQSAQIAQHTETISTLRNEIKSLREEGESTSANQESKWKDAQEELNALNRSLEGDLREAHAEQETSRERLFEAEKHAEELDKLCLLYDKENQETRDRISELEKELETRTEDTESVRLLEAKLEETHLTALSLAKDKATLEAQLQAYRVKALRHAQREAENLRELVHEQDLSSIQSPEWGFDPFDEEGDEPEKDEE